MDTYIWQLLTAGTAFKPTEGLLDHGWTLGSYAFTPLLQNGIRITFENCKDAKRTNAAFQNTLVLARQRRQKSSKDTKGISQ